MEERNGEGNEGAGVRRRDLRRCDSLKTEQSSDKTVCLTAEKYSFQLKRTAESISRPLGSIVFKEMTLALM